MTNPACRTEESKFNDRPVKAQQNNTETRKMDTVAKQGRGRGVKLALTGCQCFRPKCIVLCTNCGFTAWGRVRYSCPAHPQTVFLFDWTQCPDCKAYESLLCEFDDSP